MNKFLTAGAVLLTVGFSGNAAVHAQATGSLKVQSRYFNPFVVTSRFSVNPFGIVTATPATTTVSSPTTVSSSTSSATAGGGSGGISVTPLAAPPPYRPPVRSPFRPPPRPPFIP